jgi:hypothetical protein
MALPFLIVRHSSGPLGEVRGNGFAGIQVSGFRCQEKETKNLNTEH